MFDDIDPRSPTPLYAQIAARVRMAIAAGELAAGDSLPSVRSLSRTLRVNPATVVQAYRDLAADGFVELKHGQGTFVRPITTALRTEERSAQATELVRRLLQEALRMGIDVEELAHALRTQTGVEIRE